MPVTVQLAVRGPFSVFDTLREYQSKSRLRYKMNGFNLDMRYITPNSEELVQCPTSYGSW
jgi:hypothetical protein